MARLSPQGTKKQTTVHNKLVIFSAISAISNLLMLVGVVYLVMILIK